MTQRERQTSGGASAVLVSSPPAQSSATTAPALSVSAPDKGGSRPPCWEDLYRAASPVQQQELLTLARQQGVLYAHQLPANVKTTRPAVAPGESANLAVLAHLLNGQTTDLPSVRAGDVSTFDPCLDARQREAVSRALQTPDICLIQGLAGCGKSSVAAEIITQAAVRGERILFVAPGAAALDRVLEAVAGRTSVCAFRCLGPDEAPEHLPAPVRALTLVGRARQIREESLPAALRAREAAEARCERRRQEESLWPLLLDLADSRERLQSQLDDLRTCAAGAAAEVEREAAQVLTATAADPAPVGTFAETLADGARTQRERLQQLDRARAEVRERQTQRQQEVTALAGEVEAVRPLAEARRQKRWWSLAWWQAGFRGNMPGKLEETEAHHRQLQDDLQALECEMEQLTRQRQEAEQSFATEQARLVAEETARRRTDLADQEAALQHELALLEKKWQQLCVQLDPDTSPPAALTAAAARSARERWQAQRDQEAETCTFARQWAGYLQESLDSLAAHLPDLANVVAATTTALPGDEYFGEAVAALRPFDLLILEEADQVTDSELLRLARRACRWVLIAEPGLEATAARTTAARPQSRFPATTLTTPAALRSGCFQQLWKHLHCDPRRLPYVWLLEKDRLCCRLQAVPQDQRQRLESERVADFPEIELRILSLPRSTPTLAEVVFPPTMSIEQAKQYIYRELQELAVQASGRSISWLEKPECLALCLGEPGAGATRSVALEPGVCEIVSCASADTPAAAGLWPTCRLEFERALGWTRERAEEWASRHLRLRDLGRTVRLDVPYRMAPSLAAVISDVVWEGAGQAHTLDGMTVSLPPGVEFVAVPPLEKGKGRRDRGKNERDESSAAARPAALPRAGAGLELDLAGPRHADRLPSGLRPTLPEQGLVNYLEAEAVVCKLVELVGDSALLAAPAAGRARSSDPLIAVMALYPAQVSLIRELIRQSPALTQAAVPIEVDLPAAFRHRECLVALVSLTRSHSHRAVSLGEAAHLLPLALTRPRTRLILFGDPGTLVRRGQWQGELDHLDHHAAAREGRLAARLVAYLQGQVPHGRAFHLCEGNGS